jgi:ISXO2-like transposase domain
VAAWAECGSIWPADSTGWDQVEFAREVIAPGTEIHIDGALVLTRLSDHGFTHHPTPGYLASDLDAVMPGPQLVSSLLKRWTAGTLHHRISRQHLPYYLDEFTFRFNRRTSRARGLLFYRLLQQAAGTDPHPLSELIGGTGNDWDEPTDDQASTALKRICKMSVLMEHDSVLPAARTTLCCGWTTPRAGCRCTRCWAVGLVWAIAPRARSTSSTECRQFTVP